MAQAFKLKSLVTRINRHLLKTEERLCKSRPYEVQALGVYYLLDCRRHTICRCRVDPARLALERQILTAEDLVRWPDRDGMSEPAARENTPMTASA